MTAQTATPLAEVTIEPARVRALVRAQHPDFARFEIGAQGQGWDNIMFRLGTKYLVRLPRRRQAAKLLPMELDWLPRISGHWPFNAPIPVRIGQPGLGYPWRWSIVPWIDGTPAYRSALNTRGAEQLGYSLKYLHQLAPAEAPRNQFRSGSLVSRLDTAEQRTHLLLSSGPPRGWHLNSSLAFSVLLTGARSSRPRPTWTHLDLHGNNVLVANGHVAGIIDWGDAGAGDPATDLGQAMTLVGIAHWDALLLGYGGMDAETFKRARAEAVYYSMTLAATRQEPYSTAGWKALAELGVARHE